MWVGEGREVGNRMGRLKRPKKKKLSSNVAVIEKKCILFCTDYSVSFFYFISLLQCSTMTSNQPIIIHICAYSFLHKYRQ